MALQIVRSLCAEKYRVNVIATALNEEFTAEKLTSLVEEGAQMFMVASFDGNARDVLLSLGQAGCEGGCAMDGGRPCLLHYNIWAQNPENSKVVPLVADFGNGR
jgi:hypothetical protein